MRSNTWERYLGSTERGRVLQLACRYRPRERRNWNIKRERKDDYNVRIGLNTCILCVLFLIHCILIMSIIEPVIINILVGDTLSLLIYRRVYNIYLVIRVHTQYMYVCMYIYIYLYTHKMVPLRVYSWDKSLWIFACCTVQYMHSGQVTVKWFRFYFLLSITD